MNRNLMLNPRLANQITAVQLAIGEDGEATFRSGLGGASGMFESQGTPITVQTISLGSVVQRFQLTRPCILKVDCKGCESSLIHEAEVKLFDVIHVEYTRMGGSGASPALIDALRRQGFERFRVFKHNAHFFAIDDCGIVEARK